MHGLELFAQAANDARAANDDGGGLIAVLSLVISVIGVALALFFAVRSDRRSRDALGIAEEDHCERLREREARARLKISIVRIYPPVDRDGVVRVGIGAGRYVRFRLVLQNDGERDAGRTTMRVKTPLALGGVDSQWTDASGDHRPYADRGAARESTQRDHLRALPVENVLTQTYDGLAIGVPEEAYIRIAVTDPPENVIDTYPIKVEVVAEGANERAEAVYPLRIGIE